MCVFVFCDGRDYKCCGNLDLIVDLEDLIDEMERILELALGVRLVTGKVLNLEVLL